MPKSKDSHVIVISESTKKQLEARRRPGQTWDGIIKEMLNTLEAIEKQALMDSNG